jgi:hypothetical protein
LLALLLQLPAEESYWLKRLPSLCYTNVFSYGMAEASILGKSRLNGFKTRAVINLFFKVLKALS